MVGCAPSACPPGEVHTSFIPQWEPMKPSNWIFLPRKTRNDTKVKVGEPECNSGRAQRAGGRSSRVQSIPVRLNRKTQLAAERYLRLSPEMFMNRDEPQTGEIKRKGAPGCNPGLSQTTENGQGYPTIQGNTSHTGCHCWLAI
ncbi:hypothetical protein Mal35_09920 [Gimesia maris]|nr:hypothetical protein Mal35_09920 [Gimesia maris]